MYNAGVPDNKYCYCTGCYGFSTSSLMYIGDGENNFCYPCHFVSQQILEAVIALAQEA
jgi:hypothetical protein